MPRGQPCLLGIHHGLCEQRHKEDEKRRVHRSLPPTWGHGFLLAWQIRSPQASALKRGRRGRIQHRCDAGLQHEMTWGLTDRALQHVVVIKGTLITRPSDWITDSPAKGCNWALVVCRAQIQALPLKGHDVSRRLCRSPWIRFVPNISVEDPARKDMPKHFFGTIDS